MANDPSREFAARLAFTHLAARHGRPFSAPAAAAGHPDIFVSEADAARVALAVAPLWEDDAAWNERCAEMAERIRASLRGPYLLWVPPGGDLPGEEPAATEFIRRVSVAGAPLVPGARTEVELPARVRLVKMRDEGGYASVIGGLGRYWTAVTERVSGTFVLDTTAIKRAPLEESVRESMFDRVAQLATQHRRPSTRRTGRLSADCCAAASTRPHPRSNRWTPRFAASSSSPLSSSLSTRA